MNEVKQHLIDALRECRSSNPDIKQIEHNLYEIQNHLNIWIDVEELK